MKIRILKSVAGIPTPENGQRYPFAFDAGTEIDVSPACAAEWLNAGIAEPIHTVIETAERKPIETAVRRRKVR